MSQTHEAMKLRRMTTHPMDSELSRPEPVRWNIVEVGNRRHQGLALNEPTVCRLERGALRLMFNGHFTEVRRGEWIVLPADVPLQVEYIPENNGYVAHMLSFAPCKVSEFFRSHPQCFSRSSAKPNPQDWRIKHDPKVALAWQRLWQSVLDRDSFVLQAHFLQEVFITLMVGHDISILLQQTGLSQRIEWLLMSKPSHHWKQDEVAERLHLSGPTLRRQLAAEGVNFRTILENTRMACAWDLLHTTRLSMLELAQACGYVSASRFTARFREHFGMTPSAARKSGNGGVLVGEFNSDKRLCKSVPE